MSKATKQIGGAAKDKYFRELFASAPGLAPLLAKKLAELTKAEVSQVRIRQPLIDRAGHFGASAEAAVTASQGAGSTAVQTPTAGAKARASAGAQASVTVPATAPVTGTFDPFAFTVVSILRRQGAAALMQKLEEIAEPAHLRLLADKQHLGLPAEATSADAPTLRAAIVTAAEQRVADRRAAAS